MEKCKCSECGSDLVYWRTGNNMATFREVCRCVGCGKLYSAQSRLISIEELQTYQLPVWYEDSKL